MTQRRNYFGKKTEEFQRNLAKERIRTRPGEKTEEEIRLFGRNWQTKKPTYKDRLKSEVEKGVTEFKLKKWTERTDNKAKKDQELVDNFMNTLMKFKI